MLAILHPPSIIQDNSTFVEGEFLKGLHDAAMKAKNQGSGAVTSSLNLSHTESTGMAANLSAAGRCAARSLCKRVVEAFAQTLC